MTPISISPLVVGSYLSGWRLAVELQRDRLLDEAASNWSIDGIFFAFALRNLLRAAELAQKVTDSTEVTDALDDFDKAIPRAKDLRDVLEHFDDYSQGLGDLQHPDTPRPKRRTEEAFDPWGGQRRRHAPSGSFGFQAWRTDGSVVIAAGELTVDVVDATEAARQLAARVLMVLASIG